MKVYKVKELTTEETQYFRFMRDMCDAYGWNYDSFKSRKYVSSLPMGKKTDQGFYVISEIDII